MAHGDGAVSLAVPVQSLLLYMLLAGGTICDLEYTYKLYLVSNSITHCDFEALADSFQGCQIQ